ncbi:hypothetical protein LguiA_015033 [Lonicera macranthoides]
MEGQNKMPPESSEPDKYSKELEIAVRTVHMACLVCEKVQESLGSRVNDQAQCKDDYCPVRIAACSVQATVSRVLSEAFGIQNIPIVSQEDNKTLSKANLEAVVKTVNMSLAEAPRFGFPVTKNLETTEVLEAITKTSSLPLNGRFWVLNPFDSASEFIHGGQYAITLALIEEGEVVVGVLACPNYTLKKEMLSYQNNYRTIIFKLTSQKVFESLDKGCVIYTSRGSGNVWTQPLIGGEKTLVWPNFAMKVRAFVVDNLELATFCEPVEKVNASHSFTAGLAHSMGLRNQPLLVHNTLKYMAIARGEADVFMKFERAGHKEKIRDHAAGSIIIQEAGGVVTDARGRPLDFSKGVYLERIDRGIVACAGAKLHANIITAIDDSWSSSCL